MTAHIRALEGAIELKDDGGSPDVITKAIADLTQTVDDRLKSVETKTADRLDKVEAKLNRPAVHTKAQDETDVETKAFNRFVRAGVERMQPDEVKSLRVASDAAGGFLAPETFGNELIKLLRQFSPIRNYARVVSVGASSVKYPRRTSSTVATWVGEIADRTESEPAFEQVEITPHELATFVPVSNALLEDNSYNLESELARDLAEGFAIAEATAFVAGNGTGKPKGIMAAPGIAELKTGVAGGFPTTGLASMLIGIFHALPAAHSQNAVWMMNRNVLARLRVEMDGSARPLIIHDMASSMPPTLLGRPIVEAVDMDDIAANAFPILFGDLQGYRIVDRIALSMLRDPYTLATKGQVVFHARKRVGADLTHPDRFVKLKVAA